MSDADPMAVVCYDYLCPGMPDIRIQGEVTVRSAADAKPLVEKLNEDFGPGSHWVRTLNYTYAEFVAQQQGDLP